MNIKSLIIIQVLFFCSCGNEMKHDVITSSEEVVIDTTSLRTNQSSEKDLSFFEENSDYFIRDIDFNKDGIVDKIVSSEKYQGDELFLFENKRDHYELILEAVNLSEDGGKIIGDIIAVHEGDEVFKIHTFFPDGGFLEASHYISYMDNDLLLKRTVYETSNWRESDEVYVCDLEQNIPLGDLIKPNGFEKFKQLPEGADRDEFCNKK